MFWRHTGSPTLNTISPSSFRSNGILNFLSLIIQSFSYQANHSSCFRHFLLKLFMFLCIQNLLLILTFSRFQSFIWKFSSFQLTLHWDCKWIGWDYNTGIVWLICRWDIMYLILNDFNNSIFLIWHRFFHGTLDSLSSVIRGESIQSYQFLIVTCSTCFIGRKSWLCVARG